MDDGAVSVARLLETVALALVPLHLPHPDAPIRWVATSELSDPSPFLEGGEVLLTTGLDLRGWRSQWRQYVARLRARQVVGLGFATGLTHRQVPTGLVAACREQGLNLFDVPRRTTFVAISRAVAELLEADADRAARTSLRDQQELTRAALQSDPTEAVVTKLASLIDGAAAVIGEPGLAPVGPAGDRFDLDLARREVELLRPQGLRAAASVQVGAGTLTIQPLGTTGTPAAYLAAQVPGRLRDSDRAAIATAVALLSLAAQTGAVRRDTDRSLRTRAIELLLDGDLRTARLVLDATVAGAPPLRGSLVVARVAGSRRALREVFGRIEAEVQLAAEVDDQLWIVDRRRTVETASEQAVERGLLVGLGDPVSASDLRSSWVHAGHALAGATAANPLASWDQLVGEGPLTMLDETRARAFASSFVEKLRDDQLVETLRAFVRHHGSRLKVADELGIHRNTVSNRLAQIESRLGGSLDDPAMRVAAWLSLQVVEADHHQ